MPGNTIWSTPIWKPVGKNKTMCDLDIGDETEKAILNRKRTLILWVIHWRS